MEPSRFDDLTKALATATSRRAALKAIAATTIGGLLGLGGIGTAFAKCHNPGHNCEENSTCCSQNCCIAPGHREGVCCDTGQTCQNGTCVAQQLTAFPSCICPDGTTPTVGGCTDITSCTNEVGLLCLNACASHGGGPGIQVCNACL